VDRIVWLATVESETTETFRQKMIAASSRDAVRSRGRTGAAAALGGPMRGIARPSPGAADALQSIISRDAFNSIDRAAAAASAGARPRQLLCRPGVGLIDSGNGQRRGAESRKNLSRPSST
jgi:hypothetical protein